MSIANQSQHDAWNGDSGTRWVADADRRDRVPAPVADTLLDAAHCAPASPSWTSAAVAQTHRFELAGFDVAIGRFGTMFFDDPVAALADIRTALRRGPPGAGRRRLARHRGASRGPRAVPRRRRRRGAGQAGAPTTSA
jgi:hypothetical protein